MVKAILPLFLVRLGSKLIEGQLEFLANFYLLIFFVIISEVIIFCIFFLLDRVAVTR